ncbi:MAG: tetraacyldisaccharide 4'-kinase, partial [Fibrobacter sp.]|nr:tetraacyldisaccharide 4'-kinase [Fibrobacter sp.]
MTKDIFDSPLPDWLSNSPFAKVASKVYLTAINRRNDRFDNELSLSFKVNRKVISIGGIRAGGTGKTPSAIMVGQCIESKKMPVAFLSRGYKRKSKNYEIVLPGQKASSEQVGDEPAMIHGKLPQSWLGIGAKRVITAQKLCELTPENTVFILDDGFQHRQLRRDLNIVCVNESTLDDKLLPQGYLRESISSLGRAQVLFLTGSEERRENLEHAAKKIADIFPHLHQFIVIQEPLAWKNAKTGETAQVLPLENPAAICGIARPQRFFTVLENQNIKLCKKKVFPDHYNYTERDIYSIHKLYSSGVVTTEKDLYRLQRLKNVENLEL